MTTDHRTRVDLEVRLEPAVGSRFQPTGFPDIGAATFSRPVGDEGWEECLLVESNQSMANRLESTAWDQASASPDAVFSGLPYVRVLDRDGAYLTSSRTEAHRLASAFVRESMQDGEQFQAVMLSRLGLVKDRPSGLRQLAPVLFALDPFCLVHGVFFAVKAWPNQPKVTRAVTAFVEAHDIRRADSGGVKRDDVRHSTEEGSGSAEGYGWIPFHRTEYVARVITAFFSVDLAQLRSYGLPSAATDLLGEIARWEVRALLDGHLRFRTACDLRIADGQGIDLPPLDELSERVRALVPQVTELVGDGGPIEVHWAGTKSKGG